MYDAAMGGKIRDALSAGDLYMALQPIVDFNRREVFGYEALVRCKSETFKEALDVIKRMLHRGFILLPEGEHSNVISFTPPLTITAAQLRQAVGALGEELRRRA